MKPANIPVMLLVAATPLIMVLVGQVSGEFKLVSSVSALRNQTNQINPSEEYSKEGKKADLLVKLHGWLMVFGWVGCIICSKLVASCSKDIWTFKLFGLQIWFQLHRTLSIIGLFCIIPAYIIIFIHYGGWSKKGVQATMGTVAVSLATLQAIMGFFRPEPKSTYRNSYNWIHWFFGNVALILALANILLSALKRCREFKWLLLSCLILYVFFHDFLKKLNEYRICSGLKWVKTLQHYFTILALLIIMSMSITMLFFIFK